MAHIVEIMIAEKTNINQNIFLDMRYIKTEKDTKPPKINRK